MLRITTPAPIAETVDLMAAAGGVLKPWQRRAMVYQVATGITVAFRNDAGDLVAAGGFFDITDNLPDLRPNQAAFEVWFLTRPDLGRELHSFVRAARLTFRRLAESGPVRLRAHVRVGHRPGERLAALLGMERTGETAGFGWWEWQGGPGHQEP